MKTIIVPTDFSECSETAFPYAALIAKKTGARIVLLHILQMPQALANDFVHRLHLVKSAKANMKKIMGKPVFQGVDIADVVIKKGSVSRKINEVVKKHKADMIVMGTHGTSGWREFFIGSNAEHVVRDAEVPVLSVKEQNNDPKLETIVFASDFMEEYKKVFPVVKEFAEALSAKLNLVKVFTGIDLGVPKEKPNRVQGFKKWTNAFGYPIFICFDSLREQGIIRYANSVHADLIVLGTHGRGGLSHLIKGSIAEDLTNHAALPVLTINIRNKSFFVSDSENIEPVKQKENPLVYQIPAI